MNSSPFASKYHACSVSLYFLTILKTYAKLKEAVVIYISQAFLPEKKKKKTAVNQEVFYLKVLSFLSIFLTICWGTGSIIFLRLHCKSLMSPSVAHLQLNKLCWTHHHFQIYLKVRCQFKMPYQLEQSFPYWAPWTKLGW